jgi:hypothetical protein
VGEWGCRYEGTAKTSSELHMSVIRANIRPSMKSMIRTICTMDSSENILMRLW